MTTQINDAMDTVGRSGIRTFTQLARQIPGCMFLTIGEPDFNTAEPIKDAAKLALDNNMTHYPENNGDRFLREAIARFEREKDGLCYSPDEIIVTIGATEGLFDALFTILNPGDEVIVPTPAYGLYEQVVKLCRGVYVPLPTGENNFQITKEQLESAITERTKAVILTSPNNPTGCIYSRETLEELHRALRDRPIFVVCDDVYRQLIYTDQYESFARFDDMRDRIIVVQSFAKPYAMTGWRVGYLMADQTLKSQMEKVHQYNVVSVVSFIQKACEAALSYDPSDMIAVYRKRRDYVYRRMQDMGLKVQKPEGAFYIFPSIAKFGMDSDTFCTRLAREGKLAITPGHCFGDDRFARVSYCYGDEQLKEGMDRLERFIKAL